MITAAASKAGLEVRMHAIEWQTFDLMLSHPSRTQFSELAIPLLLLSASVCPYISKNSAAPLINRQDMGATDNKFMTILESGKDRRGG